jgi:hypothetical protein
MSVMSDLDLMVRDGERTAADFEARGIDPARASAMAEVVARANVGPVDAMLGEGRLADDIAADRVKRAEPDSAFGHGPGCFGECDGLYDCSESEADAIRRRHREAQEAIPAEAVSHIGEFDKDG